MKRRSKSAKVKSSPNQRNNARLEEATRQLTQVTLVYDGTLQGLPRDVLGLFFSRLPTQKDRRSFANAHPRLRQIHSEWLESRFGLANDQQRRAAFAAQQREMDYFLNNEDVILTENAVYYSIKNDARFSDNRNDPLLISCFKRLAKIKDEELRRIVSQTGFFDMRLFEVREEILNELNGRIIRNRIDESSIILDCDNCRLTRFPGSLLTDPTLRVYWSKLIALDINTNQLTALPPEIGRLAVLSILRLENNQLTALPPEIVQLKKLTMLELSHNQLTALPPEIEQHGSLILLGVNYNRLTKLPDIIREENKAEVLATQTPPQVEQEASPKRSRLLQQ
ncbi:MAG: leucine-rich repeat domain-containing protein [Proteobacteria bacterium]|nr:leucine-rich repeat domain-containing protein [Pseudomonadota bacterium]